MTAQKSAVARWGFWAALVAITGLYLYAIAAAIGNWVGMSNIAEILSDGLSTQGVIWLSIGVAIPVILLGASLILGRGKSHGQRLLLLLLGLTLVAVLQLDITHMIPTTRYLG